MFWSLEIPFKTGFTVLLRSYELLEIYFEYLQLYPTVKLHLPMRDSSVRILYFKHLRTTSVFVLFTLDLS